MQGELKSVSVSVSVQCVDNAYEPCEVKLSVREKKVALFIRGGDEWAHLTPRQAKRLAQWLMRGAEEADQRQRREVDAFLQRPLQGASDGTNP